VRQFIVSMVAIIRVFCQSRSDTALEVLALRQQVAVLNDSDPKHCIYVKMDSSHIAKVRPCHH
jgi:hypothetical protein